jgi:hypothetical protein
MSQGNDSIRFELLKMSRELVISEYNNQRADLHNQWIVESDKIWRTQRLRVAYPPIPPFPTEVDIIKRAKLLMDFVGVETPTTPSEDTEPIGYETVPAPLSENEDVLPLVLKQIEEMRSRLKKPIEDKDAGSKI